MPIPPDTGFTPPQSPEPLLQELFVGSEAWPWRILVLCVMLNQTSRKQVEPVCHKFFAAFPNPEFLLSADHEDIHKIVRPLGFGNKRAKTIKKMSIEYLTDAWEDVSELFGIGKYAVDAWRIFVEGRWNDVTPDDHALCDYHRWVTGAKPKPKVDPDDVSWDEMIRAKREWWSQFSEDDQPNRTWSSGATLWLNSQQYLANVGLAHSDEWVESLRIACDSKLRRAVPSEIPPGTPVFILLPHERRLADAVWFGKPPHDSWGAWRDIGTGEIYTLIERIVKDVGVQVWYKEC
jgi:methyl-CpG-binding domain protein 4